MAIMCDKDWEYLQHFNKEEFECKCGCNKADMVVSFMELLNTIRIRFNQPMIITSGFRCEEHNKAIGGVESSAHLIGKASDISIKDSFDRYKLVNISMDVGMPGIGISDNFLHLDSDCRSIKNRPAVWTYK